MRLDLYLYKILNFQSRNKAQEAIKNGNILVDGRIVTKPSFEIDKETVDIKEQDAYVSRSAKKLNFFLDDINYIVKDKIALDIGSSTGGWTQVLLENSIKRVDCVDVGSSQLHINIKTDKKVHVYENTDIRDFKSKIKYDLVVCDVSFISLNMILDDIDRLAKSDKILLFKPQFEVGKNIKRDSMGVVKDRGAIEDAIDIFEKNCKNLGWNLVTKNNSKVKGKNGNLEILYYFT